MQSVFLFSLCIWGVLVGGGLSANTPKKKSLNLRVETSFKKGAPQTRKYRILITSHPAAFGEAQAAKRITQAISNLGWEWVLADRIDQQPHYVNLLKPNFILSLREEIVPVGGVPNFLYLHVPMFMYLNKDGTLCTKAYPNVLKYDAYLQVVPDITPVKHAYLQMRQQPFYSVNTVFSVPKTVFRSTPKLRLCYWGSTWDKARGGENYQKFYKLLDNTDYFDLYGPEWSWKKMNLKSYRGTLVIDNFSLIDKISRSGIALVLHSHEHIRGATPTSRIFEAAAASAVIICDEHPFVQKEFGNAVLYINPNQEPAKVFQQIDGYVKWIRNHPAEALKLAKKAHEIFVQRFTLEGELEKIANMYEAIRSNELEIKASQQLE